MNSRIPAFNFEKDYFANFVLKDSDGFLFINYLYLQYMKLYIGNDQLNKQLIEFLELHKCKILENISANSGRERVLSKYIWVAKYHNFFCSYYLNEIPTLLIKEYADDYSFIKHT